MNMLKKKKKAFTLMELLAVIVLLAVIALIATPNVINLIEESKRGSIESSARNIAKSAENYYAQHTLLHNERVGEIDLTENTLTYKGNKPYKGYVYFDDNGNAYIKMYMSGYCVVGDYDNTVSSEKIDAKDCGINAIIIFLDLDGGKLDIEVLEYEQGDTFGELPTPTKDGYTFVGWFDKSGNPITPDTVINKSMTIYAQWEPNVYMVTLSLPNETIPETEGWNLINGVPTKEITFDTEYGMLPEPEKLGYTFTGWYTNGGFKINSTSTLIIPNNHTLTGEFEPNTYEVTYVYNNGNAYTTETVTYDEKYNLPVPTKIGYTFSGWYNGTTKVENNSVVKILEDKTFEAKWEANKYTISFNSNGGTSVNDIEVTYDSAYGILIEPTKTGYNFHGWSTSSGLPITETTMVKVTEDTTLYAQWGINNYLITYDANGGTVTPPNVTLEYNSAYGTLPTPTRTGYTFKGWYTSATGGTEVISTTKVTTASNHSIYAQWTAITYTVAYNANGGSGSMTSVSYTYDVAKTLTANKFTRTGYTFTGWNTKKDGTGTSYANSASVKNLTSTSGATVTLYAQWKINTYTVTIKTANATAAKTSISTNYNTNATTTLTAKSGYKFANYTCTNGQNGNISNGTFSVEKISANTTCTINYVLNLPGSLTTEYGTTSKYKVRIYANAPAGTTATKIYTGTDWKYNEFLDCYEKEFSYTGNTTLPDPSTMFKITGYKDNNNFTRKSYNLSGWFFAYSVYPTIRDDGVWDVRGVVAEGSKMCIWQLKSPLDAGTSSQRLQLTKQNNGYYTIGTQSVSILNLQVLDPSEGIYTWNGNRMEIQAGNYDSFPTYRQIKAYTVDSTNSLQQWAFIYDSHGNYFVRNKQNGQYVRKGPTAWTATPKDGTYLSGGNQREECTRKYSCLNIEPPEYPVRASSSYEIPLITVSEFEETDYFRWYLVDMSIMNSQPASREIDYYKYLRYGDTSVEFDESLYTISSTAKEDDQKVIDAGFDAEISVIESKISKGTSNYLLSDIDGDIVHLYPEWTK